ncbi:MAG: polyphosphate polymerase domain-containing protein, partial [Clostridia bacterium]|nr:polyphosphate polymerase domain-containing protein [Clostridia bacterium]
IKKKYDGVVYKRRVRAPEAEAVDYLNGGPAPEVKNRQIMNEIDWFIHSYKGLRPGMFLAYDRLAFRAKNDPDLRITFDWNIRYRTDRMDLIYGDDGRYLFDEDCCIMEIKIPGAAPLWLTDILSRQHIYSSPISKYGRCYEQMMRERHETQEAVTNAG